MNTGIAEAIDMLTSHKMDQIRSRNQQAQTQQGLQGLEGITPEMARSLSMLNPDLLGKVLPGIQQQQREIGFANAFQQDGQQGQVIGQQDQGNMLDGFPPPRNSREALELAKIARKEKIEKEKMAAEEKKLAFKETKEDRKKIIENYKVAKDDMRDLLRLEDLEAEGKLDTPGYIEGLKRAGLDIPSLTSEGSEEFQKITQNFIRNAKQYYGARISNLEMEQFLKTIPSLSQSPEGRKRVIANLKNIARGKKEYYNAYKEIIKENKGVPPLDLLEQVEERVEDKLDKLASLFKRDLEKEVPKGQNKLITALQVGLGGAVGRAGPALEKAAIGAALGSAVPGLGTALGAGLGGLYGFTKGS